MDQVSNAATQRTKLSISSGDIARLSTFGQGCHLQPALSQTHSLEPENCSDDEDDSDGDEFFDEKKEMTEQLVKEDRRRREFVSLVLNANRDPVKPGTKYRCQEFQEVLESEFACDSGNLEDQYAAIHRMYDNIGNFDEYMKKKNFEEVAPNRVYKLKRLAGVKLPVEPNSLVMYNCALWTEGAKDPFDSTWMRQTTQTVHLATDSILPGLHELLLTCNKGELCEALIRPEAAFGPIGAAPRIPPNATIFCLLEIVRVVTQDKMAILTKTSHSDQRSIDFDDYLEASEEARRRGNYFFEHGRYRVALQRYKSGIRLLEGLTCKDEPQQVRVNEILVKLYNNCARTANMMGNPRLALSACKQASEIDEADPKTYWHKMTAWRMKGHIDRALGVARRALQLFHDPAMARPFQKAADELKAKIQQDDEEEAQLYRLMGKALLASN